MANSKSLEKWRELRVFSFGQKLHWAVWFFLGSGMYFFCGKKWKCSETPEFVGIGSKLEGLVLPLRSWLILAVFTSPCRWNRIQKFYCLAGGPENQTLQDWRPREFKKHTQWWLAQIVWEGILSKRKCALPEWQSRVSVDVECKWVTICPVSECFLFLEIEIYNWGHTTGVKDGRMLCV